MPVAKVAIVGTGFIGRAWAISFARAGHDVALWDEEPSAPAAALAYIEGLLPDLAEHDLLERIGACGNPRADACRRRRWTRRSPAPSMCRRTRPRMS